MRLNSALASVQYLARPISIVTFASKNIEDGVTIKDSLRLFHPGCDAFCSRTYHDFSIEEDRELDRYPIY